ncbi:MAG: DUF3089 domain-containing protein [Cyclobacteriaceae bacterium]|nr:DUF3089 domain-containing protein [Cyclobacteriaceae bacterium]
MKQTLILLSFLILISGVVFAQTPAPPDYSNLYFWAASPHKTDASDQIPAFLKDEKREILADVFFIHPTIYDNDADTASANAWLNDEKVNTETDNTTILLQASVFNGSCRVFAPRYRQANMEVLYKIGTPPATAALDLAYSDLKNAFQYYLKNENNNRPIVIAGHSQGALHAVRLLKEFFDGTPLQKQLVCAYIPGFRIKNEDFKNDCPSEKPTQTGCFAGWRSYVKGEMPKKLEAEKGNSICVNPLTWNTSTDWPSPEVHKGIMLGFESIIPNTLSAGIEPNTKILWVDIPPPILEMLEKKKDLHIYDFNLFWMNIRENVKLRIEAWFKANGNKK